MTTDNLARDAIEQAAEIEELKADFAELQGKTYKPKITFDSFYRKYVEENPNNAMLKAIRQLDIDFVDNSWQKADWIAVFIAGTLGAVIDILITQTRLLKPVDSYIKNVLSSPQIKSFQDTADAFSNSFRNWHSAPIDFQDFEMSGPKFIHEQYSFGHDPIRFLEGIFQIMTGKYGGVDKFGNLVQAPFGEGISNPIQAVISYVAHMVSDMCNQQGLPYPGTTFLMQFGSDATRNKIVAAYRSQLFNARTFIYQSLPALIISLIIHSWAIYDNYVQTNKIKILIGDNIKYQSMLLASNAMVMTTNLTITAVRGYLGDHNAIFRINWPIVLNTIRHAIKFFIMENKRIAKSQKEINELYLDSLSHPIESKTVDDYLKDLNDEYEAWLKGNMGG